MGFSHLSESFHSCFSNYEALIAFTKEDDGRTIYFLDIIQPLTKVIILFTMSKSATLMWYCAKTLSTFHDD